MKSSGTGCQTIESLNIGCGADLWGDVRLDISFNFLIDAFKPTILADAHYLPFKDKSFGIVKASHVLEHLKNPLKALGEIMRVADKEIILKFPTEWDVWPAFISSILPLPRFRSLLHAYLTRKTKAHLWILSPQIVISCLKQNGWKTTCKKGNISLFRSLESGRKANYFRWLAKRFRIRYEYVIVARKG